MALQRRNAHGLSTYLLTGESRDAVELIAGIAAKGKFDVGYTDLSSMAGEMAKVKESHHFYPVLFFFRFQESLLSGNARRADLKAVAQPLFYSFEAIAAGGHQNCCR